MRRAEPAEARELGPLRIVQRANRYAAHARQRFQRPRDLRAALRAELEADPAMAFVRAMLIAAQLALQKRNLLRFEIAADAEGAARAPLARRAMACGGAQRIALGAIAHSAAEATALMDGHATPPCAALVDADVRVARDPAVALDVALDERHR